MIHVLPVEPRTARGTRQARRLRREGKIPAVLYGHQQEAMSLQVPAEGLQPVLRHAARLVNLQGAVSETAFVREVQWDTFGLEVLHVDLTRVSADERVETKVPIVLRGEAPGAKQGGMVEHMLHEVEIDCPVMNLPEELVARISNLEVGGHITAADLPLPEGAKLLGDPTRVVVACHLPVEAPEEELVSEAAGAEPELIRKEKAEEGEEES